MAAAPSLEELRAECQALDEEVSRLQSERNSRQEGVQELQQELLFLTKVEAGGAPT